MTREEFIIDVVSKGEEESLIKEIEQTPSVPGLDTYRAFLEILLQLIERSSLRQVVGPILIDKGIRRKNFVSGAQLSERRSNFVDTLKTKTPLFGVNTSDYIRIIITQILRQPNAKDSEIFDNFLSIKGFLDINEFFFERCLHKRDLGLDGMHIFYNCVADIKSSQLILSRRATSMIFSKLREPKSLRFYLRNFIRPYWVSQSNTVDEDFWYVPEPFWLQIFNHRNNFILFIRDVLREEEDFLLVNEIKNIVSLFGQYDYFDARSYRPNPDLHYNLKKPYGKSVI